MSRQVSADLAAQVQRAVAEQQDAIVQFFREIVAIPSIDSQIGPVGERIQEEMLKLGFEKAWFDSMGNTVGKIGNGPRVLLFDSHIDTVGANLAEWTHDPWQGKVEDGILYALGSCDEKCSTPGMVYGLALAHRLGLLEGWTAYYFGNMEEWCDGIACQALVEHEGIRPDFVVIGEPTDLRVYRGHKGRVELKIVAKGKSAHAASNHLGDNAIYKLLPVIEGVSTLEPQLGDDPFLGHGKITVTDMDVVTSSINAVPNEATAYVDRRLTFGESIEKAMAQVEGLIPAANRQRGDIRVEMLRYEEPSYTGFVFPVDKYYPAWALDESHALVQAGQAARRLIGLPDTASGKWDFSTNGNYWAGKAGIPSIGFAPGDEKTAHTAHEHIRLADVVKATEFYALLPGLIEK
jgi:putative selenium metabolism hydrolase